MNSLILFENQQEPVDIATFMIIFDEDKGIDLYEDA